MIPSLRRQFNENFSDEKYKSFLAELDNIHPGAVDFRLAETPVFVPRRFYNQMIDACENIVDLVLDPRFREQTQTSIPATDKVQGTYGHPHMIVFDFGVCEGDEEQFKPMLVEMQGFPSLYAFQSVYPDVLRKYFDIPSNFSQYLGTFDRTSYEDLFRKVVLGKHEPENVVLLEIEPHKQKTRVDFYCTTDLTGIKPVSVTELIEEGKKLFYLNDGRKTPIHRIYNRVIFDELHSRTDLGNVIDIRAGHDVEWIPHPDWFYRISKYTLPLISHANIPDTYFLGEIKQLPTNLEDYVLKPLFSFAGQGVVIDVTREDIDGIKDPENWILQHKVKYADVIETPTGPAKTEIRIMYLWEEGAPRPKPAINLARLSKGKMIGTRYNKDKDWVGGTVAFIER